MKGRLKGYSWRDLFTAIALRLPVSMALDATRWWGVVDQYFPGHGATRRHFGTYYQAYADLTSTKTPVPDLVSSFYRERYVMSAAAPLLSRVPDAALPLLVESFGLEELRRVLDEGRGAIIASAHLGHGGLPAGLLSRHGYHVHTVRFAHLRKYDGTLHATNLHYGTEPLYLDWKEAPAATLKRGLQLIREGRIISYLADGVAGGRTVQTTVLGRPFEVGTGFLEVARMAGAPAVIAYGIPSGKTIKIHYLPPRILSSVADIEAFAHEYAANYEKLLLNHPEFVNWTNPHLQLFNCGKMRDRRADNAE